MGKDGLVIGSVGGMSGWWREREREKFFVYPPSYLPSWTTRPIVPPGACRTCFARIGARYNKIVTRHALTAQHCPVGQHDPLHFASKVVPVIEDQVSMTTQ